MYVLLRMTGSGDYILPIADWLLGTEAARLGSRQREWKSQLRTIVSQSSSLQVSLQLLDLGSNRANETNVRNWTSSRNIKTHDPQDFAAIMKLVGLADHAEEYWNAMARISQAL